MHDSIAVKSNKLNAMTQTRKGLLAPLRLCVFALNLFFSVFVCDNISADVATRMQFSQSVNDFFNASLFTTQPQLNIEKPEESLSAKVKVDASYIENGRWRLTFIFPDPVTFTQEVDCDTLFLQFNQPVDSKDLIKVQENLGFLLKRFSNGLNSLYLVAKRPVFFRVESCDKVVMLDIIPDYQAPLKPTRLLKVASARLLQEERHYEPAFEELAYLEEEYPEDKEVLVVLANLEGVVPRWQRQVGVLQELRDLYPEDDDIRKLFEEAYSPHSPYLQFQVQQQRTIGIANVQIYQLQAEYILSTSPWNTFYTGGQCQLYYGQVLGVIQRDGSIKSFRGVRCQVNRYLRNEWESGAFLTGKAYFQQSALGVGAEGGFLLPCLQGSFTAEIDWHKPYWAVFEGLAFNGREDLAKCRVNSVYNRYLSWGFGGGIHRVGIRGTPNGFTSVPISGEVNYNLAIPNPIIGVNYSLDAEYVFQRKVKTDANGVKFNPVPFTSFENHTVRGYLIYTVRDYWYFSGYMGETFNRIGLNDFTCGAEIKYIKPWPCGWEVNLSVYRFPSTIIQGATAVYVTGSFTWRY